MGGILGRLHGAGVHDRLRQRLGDERTIRLQRLVGPLVRRSLTALALVYWSDKARNHHGARAYTDLYPIHFEQFRTKPIRLLEIGIGGYDSPTWGGASLRMWRDYFRRGEIYGLDIYEKRIVEPRIHVHRGDQSDPEFIHARLWATTWAV
jgi:hypothetical protein